MVYQIEKIGVSHQREHSTHNCVSCSRAVVVTNQLVTNQLCSYQQIMYLPNHYVHVPWLFSGDSLVRANRST